MKATLTLFTILLFVSCVSTKIYPITGKYPETPIVIQSPKTFNQVWDALIDQFAQKGLSIKIIDRSSGLIVSTNSKLSTTFENKLGIVDDPKAFVVVPSMIVFNKRVPITGRIQGAYAKQIETVSCTGDWNVRVKANDKGCTINVNLTNISYEDYSVATKNYKTVRIDNYKSTGVFENFLADLIK